MASTADIHENEMPTISKPAQLRCLDSSGNSGIVALSEITKNVSYIFSLEGQNLGTPQKPKWWGLGEFHTEAYVPVRVNISIGAYTSTDRSIIDVTLTGYDKMYISGSGKGKIGYVLDGSNIKVYVKCEAGESYIGFCFGRYLGKVPATTTEPSGIVYVP